MQSRTKLILPYAGTFLAGLLTGATVFSDVLQERPPAEPAEPKTETVAEPPLDAAAVTAQPQPEPEAVQPSLPVTEPEPEPEPPAVPPDVTEALQARVQELTAGWGRMQAELAELRQRIAMVERRAPVPDADADDTPSPGRPATPAAQRDALLRAGVAPDVADNLVWQRSQLSLARLELRDEAARDGWLGTARYREELRRLNDQQISIEDEIGVDAYDRFLFETGQPNRVAVDAVLPGSPAEEVGLQPGDVIERYGDAKVLDFQDLRAATSAGERGELVPVAVRRDGELMELWLPRGPIGIGLDQARLEPGG
jgi:hypothetical protein